MAKIRHDDYRRLQQCLTPINRFISKLHEGYAKIVMSRNSFMSYPLSDDKLYFLTTRVEICKKIENDAIARKKSPPKKTPVLAPVEFSTEDQQLVKHCIKGARVHIGGLIDMINDNEFPISEAIPKTYLIAKDVLPPIFHAMLQCSKLEPILRFYL